MPTRDNDSRSHSSTPSPIPPRGFRPHDRNTVSAKDFARAEMPRLRIAYIVTRSWAQIHIRDLAAAVAAQGHLPSVITSGTGPFIDDLRGSAFR